MSRIELNRIDNKECVGKCSRQQRKDKTIDDLCTVALSEIDSLPVRCVGEWAEKKIYHLIQYFGIFSQGMKKKWNGLNYIEICSGPGRCINRTSGEEFDGTALAIVKHNNIDFLNKALFFDFSDDVVINLNRRIDAEGISNAKAYLGNYYKPQTICQKLKTEIPSDHLNLVFIDPTDCSLPFDFIKQIDKSLSNVDFIINVASGTDFNRNIVGALQHPEKYEDCINKYTKFIGNSNFLTSPDFLRHAHLKGHEDLRRLFRIEYEKSLRSIGFNFFDYRPIKHYYDLIFASRSPKGIEFWKKANDIEHDGQRGLF